MRSAVGRKLSVLEILIPCGFGGIRIQPTFALVRDVTNHGI